MDSESLRKIIIETIQLPYVRVGVSNRHIHMSHDDMQVLFGSGHELIPVKELLPGQYASSDFVSVIGKKGRLEKVRVLGPSRSMTQVEMTLTDSFTIGVSIPINESGNLSGAGTVIIENPANGARIERACAIAALRHIHLTPTFAEQHGLCDKQVVSVDFLGKGKRGVIFGGTLLRVSKDFEDEMHIDTDEANAGQISNGDIGKIIA